MFSITTSKDPWVALMAVRGTRLSSLKKHVNKFGRNTKISTNDKYKYRRNTKLIQTQVQKKIGLPVALTQASSLVKHVSTFKTIYLIVCSYVIS